MVVYLFYKALTITRLQERNHVQIVNCAATVTRMRREVRYVFISVTPEQETTKSFLKTLFSAREEGASVYDDCDHLA